MSHQSIVEYFAEHEGYKCGYCHSPNTNYSHGMWAHCILAKDYEDLLNRGWRRSGLYCYKPTNSVTCCPMYTISCSALKFRISKSQKKVLKKFNAYLQGANLEERKPQLKSSDEDMTAKINTDAREIIKLRKGIADAGDMPDSDASAQNFAPMIIDNKIHSTESSPVPVKMNNFHHSNQFSKANNCPPSKSSHSSPYPVHTRKAKEIRLERFKQKMMEKGIDISTVNIKKNTPQVKELEDFMTEINSKSRRKFQVKLVNTRSDEFLETFGMEFDVYRKYQTIIHNDKEEDCTSKQFKRFLCDSPISPEKNKNYGTYHQQYYIEDNLVAVGVIDILPTALSSVYFFYDPEYASLTLGTFGALKEIEFLRKLNKDCPTLKHYYMGYYIHSCVKMRYKGQYSPSYLCCPKSFKWVPLDEKLKKALEQNKFIAFGLDSDQVDQRETNEDINKVSIVYRRTILPYPIYELRKGIEDKNEIQQYCNLVGEELAERLLLYRT